MTSRLNDGSAYQTKKKRPSPIAGFLRRHTQLVAFLGASLVLGNYLVGDRLRESAKDAADDAISSASLFRTQVMLNTILGTLDSLANRPVAVNVNAAQKLPISPKKISIDDVDQALQNVDSTRAQSRVFVDMMHQFDNDEAQLGDKALTEYGDQIRRLDRELAKLKNASEPANPDELITLRQQIAQTGQTLLESVDSSLSKLSTDLTERKTVTARRLAAYNRWSICIYLIGWIAAVIGRVFGAKGLDEE